MFQKRFNVYFLMVAMLLVSLTACKKWLDVDAPLQVDSETVYSTEQGFKDVMNGVYLQMGNHFLYGKDMLFGLVSIMGRSYDTTISPAIGNMYYQAAQFNMQDNDVKNMSKIAWDTLYLCVGNINSVLENIDSRKGLFTENNFNTIKGEAYGMRAFLHFEALRMFAPSPAAAGLNVPAIPYVTKLSPYATPVISSGLVIDSCIADLKRAESLLSTQDITTSRFTIWGVKGLMARIYLYKGDLANAQTQALALINSQRFKLAETNSDLMFVSEHLFSIFSPLTISLQLYKSVLRGNPPIGFSIPNQLELFATGSGSTTDWRRAFVNPSTGTALGNTISPRKFYATNANVLPMIRLTEMYYIAAECATENGDTLTATKLLDSVRVHRNLTVYGQSALKKDSLRAEIGREYLKEFLGEAQVFYYFKRKNIPFVSLPFTKVPPAPNASYVFVKPE